MWAEYSLERVVREGSSEERATSQKFIRFHKHVQRYHKQQPNNSASKHTIQLLVSKLLAKIYVNHKYHLYNNPSQALGPPKYSPPCNSIPPHPALPSSFSRTFFSSPTLIFIFAVFSSFEPSSALHEGNLSVVFPGYPSMYASVAVYEARWRGCGCDDGCYADGT